MYKYCKKTYALTRNGNYKFRVRFIHDYSLTLDKCNSAHKYEYHNHILVYF